MKRLQEHQEAGYEPEGESQVETALVKQQDSPVLIGFASRAKGISLLTQ